MDPRLSQGHQERLFFSSVSDRGRFLGTFFCRGHARIHTQTCFYGHGSDDTGRTARLISFLLSARTSWCMPISVRSATCLEGKNLFISLRNAWAVDSFTNSSRRRRALVSTSTVP